MGIISWGTQARRKFHFEKYLVTKYGKVVSTFAFDYRFHTATRPKIQALVIRNLRHGQDPISKRERSLSYGQTVSTPRRRFLVVVLGVVSRRSLRRASFNVAFKPRRSPISCNRRWNLAWKISFSPVVRRREFSPQTLEDDPVRYRRISRYFIRNRVASSRTFFLGSFYITRKSLILINPASRVPGNFLRIHFNKFLRIFPCGRNNEYLSRNIWYLIFLWSRYSGISRNFLRICRYKFFEDFLHKERLMISQNSMKTFMKLLF